MMRVAVAVVTAFTLWAAPAAAAPAPSAAAFDSLVAAARASSMTDPAREIAQADAAQRLLAQHGVPGTALRVATVKWLQADARMRLGDTAGAAPFIDAALAAIRQARGPTAIGAEILVTRGDYDTTDNNVARALVDFHQAHDMFQAIGDDRGRSKALLFIAMLYGNAGDQGNTIRYSRQARDAYAGDRTLTLAILNTLSQAYKDQRQYPQAMHELQAALALARRADNPVLVGHVLRNLARVQLLSGAVVDADRSIAEAFRLHARATPDELHLLWATAAQAALQHDRLDQAQALIRRSFAGLDPATTPVGFRESHQTAYDIFRRAGDAPDALTHLAAIKRLDDEATKLATSAGTAMLSAQFDFANQELRIAKLQRDELQRTIAYEHAQTHTAQLVVAGIAGTTLVIIVLLGIGLVTIRRSRNEVREANTGLAESNGALAKALAAKTEFLATTSHEIRTPLNGILGMTQVMLADHGLDDATRDRVTLVHGAGVTMRALVDDILDVAKMETGNLTIEAVPMELCATLGEVCRLWAEQARAKGLDFTLDLDGCPARIVGDPARLRQIVFNLLANALKFTARGAILVRACADASTQHYSVAITDTGIGIPADKLETIFESFRQADAGTTRQFGGTGLGLAICRNLARAMGGDVSVASVPGSGSTFTLTLPLIVAERAEPAVCAAAEAMLVVDRNPIARGMFKALFTPHVAELRFATGIDEAVTAVAAGGIARLLLDDTGLRGEPAPAEAIERLAKSGVPIVLLWPGDRLDEIAVLREDELTQVITKPISKKDLVNTLFTDRLRHDDMLASQAA